MYQFQFQMEYIQWNERDLDVFFPLQQTTTKKSCGHLMRMPFVITIHSFLFRKIGSKGVKGVKWSEYLKPAAPLRKHVNLIIKYVSFYMRMAFHMHAEKSLHCLPGWLMVFMANGIHNLLTKTNANGPAQIFHHSFEKIKCWIKKKCVWILKEFGIFTDNASFFGMKWNVFALQRY